MRFKPPEKFEDIPTVDQLVKHADKTIAGLDRVKRRIALLLHRHLVMGFTNVQIPTPNLLLIGPTGCLLGTERVETIDGLQEIGDLAGKWQAVKGPTGMKMALGYRGGVAEMFTVYHSAGSFTATAHHRCLVEDESGRVSWQRVESLRPGLSLLEFDASLPQSTAEPSQSTHGEDDLHYWRTLRDSMDGCFEGHHRCDEQPQWATIVSQGSSPSQVDVLGHIPENWLQDGLESGLTHIPLSQSYDLLSMQGWKIQDSHAHERLGSETRRVDALLSSGRSPVHERSDLLSTHPWLALEFGLHPHLSVQAYRSPIMSVVSKGQDEYFDLIAPGSPHYRTEGGWTHHNGGKTITVKTMLEACGIPWAEGKVIEYSPSGFQGRDLPTMYAGLVSPRWAGVKGQDEEIWTQRQMIDHAERYGVMFLDEFDKIRMIPGAPPDKDFGKPLQAELLTMTEGTSVEVRRFEGDRGFTFNTHHVLHIAVGAFEGLDDVMLKIDGVTDPTPQDKLSVHLDVDAYDIIRYGFLQELVGRFASIVPLPRLDHSAMSRILVEHVIPSYQRSMEAMGCKLVIEDGARAWLAGEGVKSKVGARGLTPLFEEVLSEQWAKAKRGDTVAITADSVQRRQAELWEGMAEAS